VKIVPILVGAVSAENEAMYGQILAQFVDDPTNFFSISSDFCHWGSRYVLLSYMLNYLIPFFLFLRSYESILLQLLSEIC
jgi:predicted class III extradiol MEMO1 family dioxygenase